MSQFFVVRRFTFTKYCVAFSGFALLSLEVFVGRSGPGAGVSLSAINNTKWYAVAGRRARNAPCRTLLVRVAILFPTLARLFPLSLGGALVSGILAVSEHRSVN